MLSIRWKQILYGTVMVMAFASCKSIKGIGAKDHSTAKTRKTNIGRSGDVKFLDDISVKPGSVVTSKHASSGGSRRSRPAASEMVVAPGDVNIERADWLQLKYAIVLDATVEKLKNLELLRSIDHWWGTRYCLGGNTENCIDCSGFTLAVMRDVYGKALPRTAQEQYDKSDRLETEDLQEGDLVFFHTSGRAISHVGIYLLNNKFVHAATSNGVMVSDLNDPYWKPRYRGAGRFGR
ncbi:C40 family peptidase [Filimonas effusa]|uniref:NlpC/P60 domain-containing protein n=1 Tax=Filimonas effusa TaxID=2508721 RepID=A0A4V1MAE5_9BACT|nr:NlpC/P60 family protein [Filimonas effusa]RXK85596.1 hypothetical protein ESB13_01925 [Filimonas effusa]